jgi:hypothetical protein
VIFVSLTLGGYKGIEKVRVIVLLTATPVAVSTGSDEDISNAGTLEANKAAANKMNEETTPTQFSHSVKIEQTVKGARITVHVNANEDWRLCSNRFIYTEPQS